MVIPSCHSKSELASGPVIQERLIPACKYNCYIVRRILSSLIATFEGVVDLVTGVWANENDVKYIYEGKTTGVDVRHCLKVFERGSCLESRTEVCSTAESISSIAPFIDFQGSQMNLFLVVPYFKRYRRYFFYAHST